MNQMQNFNLFTKKDQQRLLKKRKGETKFGEHIQLISNLTNIYDDIVDLDVTHVVFGVSEDIGVYANHGQPGTYKAWEATLKILLNIQSNEFTVPKSVLILGHLDYSEERSVVNSEATKMNIEKARTFVDTIDKDVTFLVSSIIKAGKTPIVIGGGHNNAYGCIKGAALGYNKAINAINFDAHTDLRSQEGRHSGNGFSYAYKEGFLERYFMFGLHENYTSQNIFKQINDSKHFDHNTYEALEVRNELEFSTEMNSALEFVSNKKYGIEIDCDAIENIPSSAISPVGFTTKQARQFVHHFSCHKNAAYLHICEAAPTKKTATKVGKLITYLIADFIKN